jgi:hypothetical protein
MLWPWEYLNLKFHPYKMMVVQELRERDWLNRQASPEAILENIPADADVLSSDFRVRLQECITREGKHLVEIIFKTKRRNNRNMANVVLPYSEIKF